MYCGGSLTYMWSLNVFINGFPLAFRRVKSQFCQDIRLRPAVHKRSVPTFIRCELPPYPTVNNCKSFNYNEKSQQQNLM